jgi:hypothetical protein
MKRSRREIEYDKLMERTLNPSGLPVNPRRMQSVVAYVRKITARGAPWHGAIIEGHDDGSIILTLGRARAKFHSYEDRAKVWIDATGLTRKWHAAELGQLVNEGRYRRPRRGWQTPPEDLVPAVKRLAQRGLDEKV